MAYKLTKAKIKEMAYDLLEKLYEENIYLDVFIYYNNRLLYMNSKAEIQDVDNVDPHDYFPYAANHHILSMSFEGSLYHIINYQDIEYLNNFFAQYCCYYELGNSWNLTVYPIVDSMEVEYTEYERF